MLSHSLCITILWSPTIIIPVSQMRTMRHRDSLLVAELGFRSVQPGCSSRLSPPVLYCLIPLEVLDVFNHSYSRVTGNVLKIIWPQFGSMEWESVQIRPGHEYIFKAPQWSPTCSQVWKPLCSRQFQQSTMDKSRGWVTRWCLVQISVLSPTRNVSMRK